MDAHVLVKSENFDNLNTVKQNFASMDFPDVQERRCLRRHMMLNNWLAELGSVEYQGCGAGVAHFVSG